MKISAKTFQGRKWNKLNDKAVTKLAACMLGIQNKFALLMNKSFSILSPAKRKVATICFAVIGGGLSIYFICDAITINKKKDFLENIGSFSVPQYYNRAEEKQRRDFLDEKTWKKIQAFKIYMDSLKLINDPEYQKILKERPGLMDSIYALEQIYY